MECQSRVLERKEHVFSAGDRATHVYKIEAGHVCVYRTLVDGRRHIVAFAQPGDYLGLGTIGRHRNHAQVTERSRLRCLPIKGLENHIKDTPELGLSLYEALSQELAASEEHMISVTQSSAKERIAKFLLMLANRNRTIRGPALSLVLPMTRADIADYLGLTIETVSRTLSRLRVEGIILLEQGVLVTILDPNALEAIADSIER
ncbi:MAG: hypothetical protein APF80_12290 [Alphaproteobacteria bacterium BRH_c36]|nr:MAG: hypothetical protein APF80_12290 [Alphaproteobacteria bacterium BRH_c36]